MGRKPKPRSTERKDKRRVRTKCYDGSNNAGYSGRKYFYGKDDEDIDQKISDFEKWLNDPASAQPKLMKDVVDDWWEMKEPTLSVNSVPSYKAKKEEIKAEFGEFPIADITQSEIESWLIRVGAKGFSQRGVSDRRAVIRNILDYAVGRKFITVNPVIGMSRVKGAPRKKRKPAAERDILLLEDHKTDSLIARLYYFMEYTGCRIGEAIVLQEKDIDRVNHKARISKDVVFDGNIPVIKDETKTEAGMREIDLYDNVLEILPKYKDPDTFVFFPDGLPHKSHLQRLQKKFRDSIGISSTAHQLRHTYAGIMHSAEIDVKDTQARMGHANIAVTQDIYTEIERLHNEKVRNKANAYIMEERLKRNKKRCPKCGSIYLQAEDGHAFSFCPDCGEKMI